MNKKVLGVCIAAIAITSGVGIALAIKGSKSSGSCKSQSKSKKISENIKIKGINEEGVEISIEPKCFVTNVFITKKGEETRSCCSSN